MGGDIEPAPGFERTGRPGEDETRANDSRRRPHGNAAGTNCGRAGRGTDQW